MKTKDVLIWGGIIGGGYFILKSMQSGQPLLAPLFPIFGGTGTTVIPAADTDFTSDEDIGVAPIPSPTPTVVTPPVSSPATGSRNISNTPSLAIWNKPELSKNQVTQAILDQYGLTKEHLDNWNPKNPWNPVKPVQYVQISGVSSTTGKKFHLPPKPKGYY